MPVRDVLNLVGRRLLDRYAILEPLARGGMSVIYLADDERLRRRVCVKVFSGLSHQREAYRTIHDHFVQEAFALSQLQHPNTLRIYDFGHLGDPPFGPFHVTEWIDGPTLAAHVRKHGPFPPAEALAILEPVVGALAEAHARGIVHRDLKPANILIGSVGEDRLVKLADFGIAQASGPALVPHEHRPEEPSAGSGETPISLYSVGWAAPEQLGAGPVGPTADIYALGLVATLVLTGERIFTEEDGPAALGQRLEGDDHVRRRLAALRLAPPVAAVVLRACKADPALRFRSVEAFLAALRAALTAAPARVTVPRPAPPECRTIEAGEEVEVPTPGHGHARLKITRIPLAGRTHIHVRGVGCFVARPGARPSRALDFDRDGSFEIVAMDRTRLDTVACTLSPHVVLDFGPGRSRVALRYPTGRRPS